MKDLYDIITDPEHSMVFELDGNYVRAYKLTENKIEKAWHIEAKEAYAILLGRDSLYIGSWGGISRISAEDGSLLAKTEKNIYVRPGQIMNLIGDKLVVMNSMGGQALYDADTLKEVYVKTDSYR
ncbi:TPA: hypothetical protein HA239_04010 [Candidatus Woesearchaeota archaeon]|nr:hypothetical protein [Candidatus Woesearchaeota archaeon]HIH41557.1 hypothetical protein [Candidatus Woesearchaeota archaeon]